MDEIANLLECPVCFQHSMSDTYFQCRNGHIGCIECFSNLENCSICRIVLEPSIKPFSQETITALQLRYFQVTKLKREAVLKTLTDLFKCTRRKQIPTRRNIWQCCEGHIKCIECEDRPFKVLLCRLCDDECSLSRYRSIFAEKLFSLVVKPCRHADRGCNTTMLELTDHEKAECGFRDIRCIFIECKEIVPLHKFALHMRELNQFHYYTPQMPNWDDIATENTGFIVLPENLFDLPVEKYYKIFYLKLANNKIFFLFLKLRLVFDIVWPGST